MWPWKTIAVDDGKIVRAVKKKQKQVSDNLHRSFYNQPSEEDRGQSLIYKRNAKTNLKCSGNIKR